MKRAALVLVLIGACGGEPDGGSCTIDGDCSGGQICAHSHECLAADQVHSVTIHWTIGGQPPTAASCTGIDHLDVGYESTSIPADSVLFSPVLCVEGAFPNDKWPIRYDIADVEAQAAGATTYGQAAISGDPTVDVTVDVPHP